MIRVKRKTLSTTVTPKGGWFATTDLVDQALSVRSGTRLILAPRALSRSSMRS